LRKWWWWWWEILKTPEIEQPGRRMARCSWGASPAMAAAAALLLTLLLAGMDREIGSEEEAAIVLGNSEGRADMLGLSGMSKLESIKRLLARYYGDSNVLYNHH